MSVTTKPLHPLFAAEVQGIDLRKGLTPDEVQGVVDAINTHAVLVFRHDGDCAASASCLDK